MAEGLRSHSGGILGLHRFLEEHGEAVEFDLLTHGYSYDDRGTEALSWRALWVLVRRWQQRPDTATSESVHGVRWGVTDQLLAVIADDLAVANWQRAGKKNAAKPKPIQRPWEKSKSRALGKDPIPVSQFDGWWETQSKKK